MNNHIYTIGREFGSGGKDVGIALAKSLGVKCYDKELLDEAAKESGFYSVKPQSIFSAV